MYEIMRLYMYTYTCKYIRIYTAYMYVCKYIYIYIYVNVCICSNASAPLIDSPIPHCWATGWHFANQQPPGIG